MAYSRLTLIYICINFIRFKHWAKDIKEISTSLYQQINVIINKTYQLDYITNMNKNKLIPEIKNNQKEFNQLIINNIKRDKLKFKYNYELFGAYDNLKLMQYILEKDDDWVMQSSDLEYLYNQFNGRYDKQYIRKKCFKYGVDFKFR